MTVMSKAKVGTRKPPAGPDPMYLLAMKIRRLMEDVHAMDNRLMLDQGANAMTDLELYSSNILNALGDVWNQTNAASASIAADWADGKIERLEVGDRVRVMVGDEQSLDSITGIIARDHPERPTIQDEVSEKMLRPTWRQVMIKPVDGSVIEHDE